MVRTGVTVVSIGMMASNIIRIRGHEWKMTALAGTLSENACRASTSSDSLQFELEGSLRLTSTRFVCVMVENHQIYWQRGPGVYGYRFQQVVPDSCLSLRNLRL